MVVYPNIENHLDGLLISERISYTNTDHFDIASINEFNNGSLKKISTLIDGWIDNIFSPNIMFPISLINKCLLQVV